MLLWRKGLDMLKKIDRQDLLCEENLLNNGSKITDRKTQISVSTNKIFRFDGRHKLHDAIDNDVTPLALQEAILNFLYELPQRPDKFVENVLSLLYTHFGFKNAAFFYPNSGHNIKDLHNKNNFIEDCLDNYIVDGIANITSKPKDTCLFLKSPMSCEHLPAEFRDKDVVLSSELPESYTRREVYEDFYKFYTPRSFTFFASMQLTFPTANYIGRIGFAKTDAEGDFTEEDVYILNKIARHIAYNFYFSIDYYYKIEKIKLFDKLNSHLNTGLIAVNSKLQVFCANKVSYRYCMDILEHKKISVPKNHSNKRILQQMLIDMLSDNIASVLNEDSTKFVCSAYVYILTGTSCIMQDYKNDLIPYYFFYITKKDNNEATIFEKFAQKYNLSSRELAILTMLDCGNNTKTISTELYISYHTVKTHIANIFRKVNVCNRAALLHKLRHEKHDGTTVFVGAGSVDGGLR
jgi:DNA-binding CsgD family transcriptional regulator